MIRLKDILKEDEVEDNFGKVFLGNNRDIAKLQGKEPEKNTPSEKKILIALTRWVAKLSDSGWDSAQKTLMNNYPLLKKAASTFPTVLKPKTPNGTELYRGLNTLNPSLKSQLFKTSPSDWIEAGTLWRYTKPISYTPHQDIQSWSTNKLIARGFSTELDFKGGILITNQNDEFLFNQDLISIINSKTGANEVDESEVLHFGKQYSNDVYIMVHDPVFKEIKDYYFRNR